MTNDTQNTISNSSYFLNQHAFNNSQPEFEAKYSNQPNKNTETLIGNDFDKDFKMSDN